MMVGLYYDPDALSAAQDLIAGWSAEERQRLRDDVPRLGLAAKIQGRDLRAVALDMLSIARGGLKRRARLDAEGRGRDGLAAPLEAIAESGRTPAEAWIDRYRGPGSDRSIRPLRKLCFSPAAGLALV